MYAKSTSSNLRDTTMVDGEGSGVCAKSTSWSSSKVAIKVKKFNPQFMCYQIQKLKI